jgi:ankyrin repeat protein
MSRNKEGARWGKRMLLACLPWEMLLLISELLDLEDLRAMIMTCSYINTVLDSMLYKRAIATGVYKQKFLYAAVWGRATAISKFFKEGVLMTQFDSYTYTWWSCDCHNLIHAKRNMPTWDPEIHPLLAATLFGHVDVIRTLLAEGNANVDFENDSGQTALIYAINNGRLDVAEILLRQGAKLMALDEDNKYSPFIYATKAGNKDALELMLRELQNRSIPKNTISNLCQRACLSACDDGHTDMVEFFLLKGVCVNDYFKDEGSLLYRASIKAHCKMFKLLVKYGARMENEKDTGAVSVFRHQPLPTAKIVVKELLKSGCNVANGNRHACALWRIARGYNRKLTPDRKLIDLLQERGFDKKKCRDKCWTKNIYRFQGDDMMSVEFFDYVKGDA